LPYKSVFESERTQLVLSYIYILKMEDFGLHISLLVTTLLFSHSLSNMVSEWCHKSVSSHVHGFGRAILLTLLRLFMRLLGKVSIFFVNPILALDRKPSARSMIMHHILCKCTSLVRRNKSNDDGGDDTLDTYCFPERFSHEERDFILSITPELMKELQVLHSKRSPEEGGGNSNKPVLVLDLDETLIHSSVENKKGEHDFVVHDEEHRQQFLVYKRPFVCLFIHTMAQFYELSVFTASFACYSDPIISLLDPFHIISKRVYNTSLTPIANGYEKDLSAVSKSHLPKRIIMVDNSPTACLTHHENLYVIESFRAETENDKSLIALIPLLVAMSDPIVKDFRCVFHRKNRFVKEF